MDSTPLIHTTLVGLEPTTFRSLVRRATSSATEPTEGPANRFFRSNRYRPSDSFSNRIFESNRPYTTQAVTQPNGLQAYRAACYRPIIC